MPKTLDNFEWEEGVAIKVSLGLRDSLLPDFPWNAIVFSKPYVGQKGYDVDFGDYVVTEIMPDNHIINVGEETFRQPTMYIKETKRD